MRFVLPLVALCALSSAPLRADMFNITLTGDPGSPSWSGTLTTDGTCSTCIPGAGLLSFTIDIDRDSGTDAFDIIDDLRPITTSYDPGSNAIAYVSANSETGDMLAMGNGWVLNQMDMVFTGTYCVTPSVPEPRSLLLMPIVAIVGLRLGHQRYRA